MRIPFILGGTLRFVCAYEIVLIVMWLRARLLCHIHGFLVSHAKVVWHNNELD